MRRRHTYTRIEKNEEINVVHVALHLSLAAKNRLTFPNQQSPSNCSWEIMVSWTQQFILNKICHFSPLSPWWKIWQQNAWCIGLATSQPHKKTPPKTPHELWTTSVGSSRLDGGGLPTARSVAARICLLLLGDEKPWKAPCREQVPRWVGLGRLEISKSTIRVFCRYPDYQF